MKIGWKTPELTIPEDVININSKTSGKNKLSQWTWNRSKSWTKNSQRERIVWKNYTTKCDELRFNKMEYR